MSITIPRILTLVIVLLFSSSLLAKEQEQMQEPDWLGLNWMFFGDSQTDGRAMQAHTKSHALAVRYIWEATFGSSVDQTINGRSGRTLEGTRAAYKKAASKEKVTWVHFQESGNQLSGGGSQNTPEKFAFQFERMVRSIAKLSPKAVISTETAYSFEAENKRGRDWDEYNKVLVNVVKKLRAEGIRVYVAQVDRNIRALVKAKRSRLGKDAGQQAVWGGEGNKLRRHYTGLGNLMVALSIYDALGISLKSLSFESIPDHEVSPEDRALCLELLSKNSS